jgi:hypothetical protein
LNQYHLVILKNGLPLYHADYVKQFNSQFTYEACMNDAHRFMESAKTKNTNIYVSILRSNHLIYKLLDNLHYNWNIMTFHIKSNIISVRNITTQEFDDIICDDDYHVQVTTAAFLHYFSVILYDSYLVHILDEHANYFYY